LGLGVVWVVLAVALSTYAEGKIGTRGKFPSKIPKCPEGCVHNTGRPPIARPLQVV